MRDIFSKTPSFDFLSKQKFFFFISSVFMIIAIIVWFQKGSDKYGIDFVGGNELVLQVNQDRSADQIRDVLAKGGLEGAAVKSYDKGKGQFSVRFQSDTKTEKQSNEEESIRAESRVLDVLKKGDINEAKVLSAEYIGPTVGAELRLKALIAISVGLVGILLYLTLRFELAFAIGAVVALAHDVIFSVGVYLLFGYTINMETLAAALTIIGYSVNDTIVIFDRIREEIYEEKPGTLSEITNRSINAMLSRTIVTHLLTTVSVLALLIFVSGAIEDLSAFLLAGMVSGSYSTMYIASPIMIAWHKARGGTEQVS